MTITMTKLYTKIPRFQAAGGRCPLLLILCPLLFVLASGFFLHLGQISQEIFHGSTILSQMCNDLSIVLG